MKLKIIVFLIGVLYLIGCSRGKKKDESKKEFNIAAILSMTGSGKEYGQDERRAIEIYKDSIKQLKNFEYNINFFIQDSKSSPSNGVSALQNIMVRNNIDVAMSVLSSVSLSLIPITEKKEIPIFCVGSNPDITKNREYVFRSLPTSSYQAEELAKEFISKRDFDSFAILHLNDDFGIGSKRSFQEVMQKNDKEIVAIQQLAQDETDYRTPISKVINQDPEVIYLASYGNSIAIALKQLRELNYEGQILSTLEVSYPKVLKKAGNAANGVYFVNTNFKTEKGHRHWFVKAYMERYNEKPSLDAILAHDEINVIHSVLKHKGSKPSDFKAMKGSDKRFISPNGHFTINKDGDFHYPMNLMEIVNKEPQIVK